MKGDAFPEVVLYDLGGPGIKAHIQLDIEGEPFVWFECARGISPVLRLEDIGKIIAPMLVAKDNQRRTIYERTNGKAAKRTRRKIRHYQGD